MRYFGKISFPWLGRYWLSKLCESFNLLSLPPSLQMLRKCQVITVEHLHLTHSMIAIHRYTSKYTSGIITLYCKPSIMISTCEHGEDALSVSQPRKKSNNGTCWLSLTVLLQDFNSHYLLMPEGRSLKKIHAVTQQIINFSRTRHHPHYGFRNPSIIHSLLTLD